MTFVGKILIILQLTLSVSFLAFAAAVYTAERNWRDAHGEVSAELAAARQQAQGDAEAASVRTTQLENELAATTNRLALTDEKLADAEANTERVQVELDEVRTALERQTSLTTLAQEQAAAAENNAARVRALNSELQSVKAELLGRNRKLDDQLYALQRRAEAMREKQLETLSQKADLTAILTANGLSTDLDDYPELDRTPPPTVEGRVLTVAKPQRRGASEFVQISLGSDDGLSRGDELFVYSEEGDGQYLGKIVLVEVEADLAVGRVVSKSKNGVIAEGQSVTTKL